MSRVAKVPGQEPDEDLAEANLKARVREQRGLWFQRKTSEKAPCPLIIAGRDYQIVCRAVPGPVADGSAWALAGGDGLVDRGYKR